MHNSSNGYQNDEDSVNNNQKLMESQPDEIQSKANTYSNIKYSQPKNQISNIGIRGSGVLGTYGRIIPRKPVHDYQRLYSDNMQLKQKIKNLEDNNLKLKTRLSMADKQKQAIVHQFRNADNYVGIKDRRPSQMGKKMDKSHKFANDENRKILHEYKDQINKLSTENTRLKKTVKYTQIKQIQIQNEYLQEEIRRLKDYIEDIIQSTQYDEYEREIEKLNKQLHADKDQIRSLHMQMKKKDEEVEDYKQKMKSIANRKTQLQKKYIRDTNNMRGQINRYKEQDKQVIPNQPNGREHHTKSIQHRNKFAQSVSNTIKQCQKCKQKQKQLINLKKQKQKLLTQKNKSIVELNSKTQQLQKKLEVTNMENKKHEKKKTQEKQLLIESRQIRNKDKIVKKKTQENIQKQISKKSALEQNSYSDQYKDSDESQKGEDQVDMLHVDLDNAEKQEKLQQIQNKNKKNPTKTQQDNQYGDDGFEQEQNGKKMLGKDNSSDEEEQVLFQKQDKKEVGIRKKSQHKKKKKQKKQNSSTNSKAQKILHQTIYYRLMAQRYTFNDFSRDLQQSGAREFSLEDLIGMLTNEPFFLTEQHLQMLLFKCFQKQQLSQEDSIKTDIFINKMKIIIGDVPLNDEEQQEKILKKIQKKINKDAQGLIAEFQNQGNNEIISKKAFIKVLKQKAKLTDKQIEQCLAQASVVSGDIAHISHNQFMEKIVTIG